MLRIPVDGTRLRILTWLSEPAAAERGLTADDIATRLGVTRPAALTHLRLLTALGLLRTSADLRCYRRDEVRIAEVAHMFDKGW
ncbi:helix-turn-helix domain-containing protein [Streptomyces sp. NPDC088106]|uniref:helix-turn-helix domain-containing protein n=1 Tax=Streptomyces sp. NPDC088106 TaxID=3154867 RepID=UPI00341591A5